MLSLFALFFGPPGVVELVVVSLIVLLLFGKRLPSVMGSLGRSVVEFKKGISGVEDEVDKAKKEIEDAVDKEVQKQKETTEK